MSDEEYRRACADAESAGLDFGKYVRKLLADNHPGQERRRKDQARRELARFVERVREEQERLQPLVPEVAAHDLELILASMLRPIARRRFFLRRAGDGYAF
jgi:hypothetical protein